MECNNSEIACEYKNQLEQLQLENKILRYQNSLLEDEIYQIKVDFDKQSTYNLQILQKQKEYELLIEQLNIKIASLHAENNANIRTFSSLCFGEISHSNHLLLLASKTIT